MKMIFTKDYDGESRIDLSGDVYESFDSRFNECIKEIPQDEYGFLQGTFSVSITWKPE